jgi:solute carrier family 25 phosphate transporter 23/24/25/41
MQALRLIWKEEGFYGYFKGNGANCIRIFPNSALQFFSYETYKKVLDFSITTKQKNEIKKFC